MCKEECKSEEMKYRLAEAVKVCMKTTSVEKITVKEICEHAEINRSTFYKHYQDVYDLMEKLENEAVEAFDLVNWYFDKILLESFEHMGEGETIYEGLVKKFQYIQKEKLFFKMAFKSDDQNCLRDHDFELILAFYSDRIQEKSGKPLSKDLKFLLEMYCQGSIYMTVQWVFGRVKRTPEELAADLVKAMPEELAGVFERLDLL